MKDYTKINQKMFDKWVEEGWQWGIPITKEVYDKAKQGIYEIYLTPTKKVPNDWLKDIKGKHVLGLASGGGQQIPILKALGAKVTCLDISEKQLETEKRLSKEFGYDIYLVQADMTNPLPFQDETFDLIFYPVSNVYIEKVEPVFLECYRILKKGGVLLSGLDNGFNFAFDDEDGKILFDLPFNPLKDIEQYEYMVKHDYGIQFSHTMEEQIGGQLRAGFRLVDIYEDTNLSGYLKENNIPSFYATKSIK
ncbi:class I SAM-dependent methyltransferase [Acholeplasma laidlawii]|uniref:class I SAM-dependent methyltransferase n=1 Tax=Acholeplasma laidlawii TaxID=2148 RepID=UPI00084C0567|nr:class I SAM-dependent methyltransferase [Acholeplasma laidlawii]OED58800.1 methyltransferase [Acholeplasma laidlawii]